MRYKILLTGKNQAIVDDFFYSMNDEFECQTTSIRAEDIACHVRYFLPDAFVYCISEETRENIMKLISAMRQLGRRRFKMILIGDSEDCSSFLRMADDMVSLTLLKPITANAVKKQIVKFLEEKERIAQEIREEQEKIAKEKNEIAQEMKKSREELGMEEKIRRMQEEKEQRLQREKKEWEAMMAGPGVTKHILIIDDDPRMLRLIKEELRDKYNVATAVSGKIALNFLERKKTDLILLDYEMPEEDGPAVLRKLRANEKTRDIPVIFLTGINDKDKIQKALNMKPQGYLLKPIETSRLFQAIRQIIG